jgi:hypothetical protein
VRLALQSDGRRVRQTPMYHPSPRGMRGLGDQYTQNINTGASIAKAGASATIASLVAVGAIGGPIGAAIGAAAGLLIQVGSLIAQQFEGCGETCTMSSNDANQIQATIMLPNLRAYVAAPYNPALQAAALNNFDTAWAALSQACNSGMLLGTQAGTNCITDRQAGACTWKASQGGWVPDANAADGSGYSWTDWGPNGSGSVCWNWFVGFRDPIANDPRAASYVPPPMTGGTDYTGGSTDGSGSGSVTDSLSSIPTPLLLGGAALLLLALAK